VINDAIFTQRTNNMVVVRTSGSTVSASTTAAALLRSLPHRLHPELAGCSNVSNSADGRHAMRAPTAQERLTERISEQVMASIDAIGVG
jgi:hypothetical protein